MVASRSNWSKISRTTAWTCSSGSITHSPVGTRKEQIGGRPSNWQAEQLAAAGLVQLPLVHPLLEDVELRLVHDPVKPQEKTIRMIGRVVHPVGVGQRVRRVRRLVEQCAHEGDGTHPEAGSVHGIP